MCEQNIINFFNKEKKWDDILKIHLRNDLELEYIVIHIIEVLELEYIVLHYIIEVYLPALS
jgi:hypothetical protein